MNWKSVLRNKNVRNALQVVAGSGGFALLVFGTKTITAPSVEGGKVLTALIYGLTIVALLGIFRRQTLANLARHLTVATIVALPIALVGGHFWAGEPWSVLLSEQFFTSIAHVAFLVGVFTGSIADARTGG